MKHLLPLAALCALTVAGPTQAQLFSDSDARRQIVQLRQEVQGQLETTGRGQLELAMQNEQLRAEVARLRGQIELLTNEVETLKQRQKDFYVDLDTRLRRIESGPASHAAAPADPAAESADYQAALNLLKDNKHKEALTALEAFVARHPAGTFTAGAHFWAGNAALQLRDIATANRHFTTVLEKWPADAVAPDAMLGLANGQQAMGDAAASRRTLQSLTERYPQSNAAQVARQRLAKR